MTAPDNRSAPWPGWIDLLIFWGSIIVALVGGIVALDALSDVLEFATVPEKQSIFQYGGTAVLVWLLFVGTLSFLVGGFAVRRMRRARARWLSGVAGALYAFVFVALSLFVPMSRGSLGGQVFVAFFFLFPAVGLLLGSLRLKRSISPLQTSRPQAGGS